MLFSFFCCLFSVLKMLQQQQRCPKTKDLFKKAKWSGKCLDEFFFFLDSRRQQKCFLLKKFLLSLNKLFTNFFILQLMMGHGCSTCLVIRRSWVQIPPDARLFYSSYSSSSPSSLSLLSFTSGVSFIREVHP